MPTRKQRSPLLEAKIAHLRLRLSPLVPLPSGPPHPSFPQTLLAYHLLTEEELDGLAHYYHQSTPSIFTDCYPACMNWEREFLDASRHNLDNYQDSGSGIRERRRGSLWWEDPSSPLSKTEDQEDGGRGKRWSVSLLTDEERIAIKRRKVGKFIGLVGMETPALEMEGRVRFGLRKAVRNAREERRRVERELGSKI